MEKLKQGKAWWKKILIVLACMVGFVGVVLIGARLYFRLPVSDYYDASVKTFEIPGTGDGHVAQGLAHSGGKFFVTGYMKDGSASPLYIVDDGTNELERTLFLQKPDGSAYNGHCGGLTVHGEYIYIAASDGLIVYSLSEALEAKNCSDIVSVGYLPLGTEDDRFGTAFVATEGNHLIVGEFYRAGNYETPSDHWLTTPAGDYNQAIALAFAYSEDEDAAFGVNTTPEYVYSLPAQVQGMEFRNGEMYLSTSYGVAKSHILIYDLEEMASGSISLMGGEYPVYFADSASRIADILIAPMSEELVFNNGRLYVMCESASDKYIFGKFTSAKWCYATDIDKLRNKD